MFIMKIHNVETGEIIEREPTAEELAQWQSNQAKAELEKTAKEEANIAKLALLERLGITEDEAKLLLS